MKILMLIMIFFCVGAFFIISQNNLALNNQKDIDKFVSLYKAWLEENFKKAGSLTGNVIKMEWLPD